jgi:hypothetical protein
MNVTIHSYNPPVAGDPDQRAAFTATIDVARNISIRVQGEHRRSSVALELISYDMPRRMDLAALAVELIGALVLQAIEQTDRSKESSLTG